MHYTEPNYSRLRLVNIIADWILRINVGGAPRFGLHEETGVISRADLVVPSNLGIEKDTRKERKQRMRERERESGGNVGEKEKGGKKELEGEIQ
ncbi:hypothetical protein E2C01_030406 [Portunus trituberculatus]|uniref:Uncharacterized protein n=1 Tax=Portunus trituberculatus TaxID=210409 RepID=A0A5B7EUP6_PORTR|nr:hypothetical protein [Portunus trituberculatus]